MKVWSEGINKTESWSKIHTRVRGQVGASLLCFLFLKNYSGQWTWNSARQQRGSRQMTSGQIWNLEEDEKSFFIERQRQEVGAKFKPKSMDDWVLYLSTFPPISPSTTPSLMSPESTRRIGWYREMNIEDTRGNWGLQFFAFLVSFLLSESPSRVSSANSRSTAEQHFVLLFYFCQQVGV